MSAITRTVEEIAAEIAALNELKPHVPKWSHFGENNHAKIDAQIDVLTERRDDDDVYAHYDDGPERESALDTAEWLMGNLDVKPSAHWEHFAK
jgi:hypothetical protein